MLVLFCECAGSQMWVENKNYCSVRKITRGLALSFRVSFHVQGSPEPIAVYVFTSLQWSWGFLFSLFWSSSKILASSGPSMRNLTHLLNVAWKNIFIFYYFKLDSVWLFHASPYSLNSGLSQVFPCFLSSCPRLFFFFIFTFPWFSLQLVIWCISSNLLHSHQFAQWLHHSLNFCVQ